MSTIKDIAYNCRRATLLIEKKQLTVLTMREKLELKMHLAGCSVCRLFEQQSLFINRAMHRMGIGQKHNGPALSAAYKAMLQKQVEQRISG
ncbi:hypothetical protein [Mucilaginibacter sp.]